MKTKPEKIQTIATALNAYSNISQPPEVVTATLNGIDDRGLATLYGISGVFCHAVRSRMPAKWLKQIHGDLLDAFTHYANEAHDDRARRRN